MKISLYVWRDRIWYFDNNHATTHVQCYAAPKHLDGVIRYKIMYLDTVLSKIFGVKSNCKEWQRVTIELMLKKEYLNYQFLRMKRFYSLKLDFTLYTLENTSFLEKGSNIDCV